MASIATLPSSSSLGPRTYDPSALPSDTPYASSSSDLTEPTEAFPTSTNHPVIQQNHGQGERKNRPRIPSLSIRSRAFSSASSTSSSPVRRKPLPVTASPLATRFSTGAHFPSAATSSLEHLPELPEPNPPRAYSLDSPTLHEFPPTKLQEAFPTLPGAVSLKNSKDPVALPSEDPSDSTSPPNIRHPHHPQSPSLTVPTHVLPPDELLTKHAVRLTVDSALTSAHESVGTWYSDSSTASHSHSTMSIFSAKPTPPHNLNSPHGISRSFTNESTDSNTTVQKSQPKSPNGSKLGSFFGWGGGNSSPGSSTTSLSENSFSPIPPLPPTSESLAADASKSSAKPIPAAIDVPKANADTGSYFGASPFLQIPLATPTTPIQIEEMEKELKEISSELASSIRREMDLEDLVERLQAEAQNPSPPGRRTSDYFSDSGTSSVRYGGEPDAKQDELDRAVRKTQVEKAQMRLELTDKVQDERSRRKVLEAHIRSLEEKASQIDLASINSLDSTGRLKDLEATCEDLRRRLTEERQVKENFEDLLTALKSELLSSHNERDNLRDEIVPQLRARVEGLEAQAAEHEKLTYEQSKMQQELQSLKIENMNLANAQKQVDLQQQVKKFDSIAEEPSAMKSRASMSLSRSNSVAVTRSRPGSLTRSASVKTVESRDALAERVKDIELQRDSLHRALKSLLERQEYQNRENQKKIRQLEVERDRALSDSPRRMGYDREVTSLREEINTLRRRADEAIEQKWQCEKGLSGLKMDLDRAEQEIGSLRSLLQENDILIPRGERPQSGSRPNSGHVSSAGLESAYKDLQNAYSDLLDRLKSLEASDPKDEETRSAMRQLEQSLAAAMSERDFARQEADSLREQTDSLRSAERAHVGEEMALADELRSTAQRVEELAIQVHQQLAANSTLRQRLAETIERGEKDQKTNAHKIMLMQSKLKLLEDQLMAAQQSSEEKLSKHEDEIRVLKDSHNTQLQRVKDGLRSPRLFGPKTPLSPLFANSVKSPQLLSTSSGSAMSVSEDSKMEFLKQRVMDLERALADADREMEEVVGRMNVAQIEVMELQNEREEAQRETRRLQRAIEQERVKAFEGRFATLSS
ncbi:hypothetical protein BJ875DRAFT_13719 [Amylocarpus encephaloides]|uniref:DUF7603 domain-containing protein n=1 Tax=Amylocarpus encephaloides TaxID=45428 RepID=A0A9P7YTC8_9HELO|nr:hypothetical protein BJ875DRAFT_13719 [Amylocarpus encephaloides]